MTREEAITIIKPLMLMMKNPQGEVISDAYYALEMAVQALSQEPCEDAISRKVLISHIKNQIREWGEDYDVHQILGDIEDMPSIKPQEPKWISVSERLPEEQGIYLAYIINEHDNKLQYPMTAYFSPNKVGCSPRWFPDDETASNNVVAWMPLPHPYEPQESEE